MLKAINLAKIDTEKESKLIDSFAYNTSEFLTLLESDFQDKPFALS